MDKLNKQQLKAVNSLTGNTLVLAGAGTGKTRVLINRIVNLIEHEVDPSEILAFTFTNKAANEMKYRIKQYHELSNQIQISTFHSFCYSYLYDFSEYVGYPNKFNIIDDDDRLKIIKEIIKNNNIEILDKDVLKIISNIKNHTSTEYESINQMVLINFIFHEYQKKLIQNAKMDLDDLLYQFQNLMQIYPYLKETIQERAKYILVDECQDTNLIQYEILETLSEINNNLFMVGDQDQCIYTFRGSHLENIKTFIDNKNPEIIKLEENYRSNDSILNVANNLIKNNQQRVDKTLYSSGFYKNYQVIYAELNNSFEEAKYISALILKLSKAGYLYKDIAVLYRNHQISNNFEKELVKNQIPYQMLGSLSFFKHKEIKTIVKYYHFFKYHDDISLKEIYNIPNRKIGETTFFNIEREAIRKGVSIYQQMLESDNEHVKGFIKTISVLEKYILEDEPHEFIKRLLSEIKYNDYLLRQEKAKIKLDRMYEFIKMFEDIKITDNPFQETLEFLNQINLENEVKQHHDFVKLMTIHQAKGLEFKVVIIAGINEGIIPSYKTTIKDIEEERRIFYVAITRAKERLYLLSSKERIINGKVQTFKPSSFLQNINIKNLYHDNKGN